MSRASPGSVLGAPGGDAGLELGEGRRAGQRVLSALQNCDVDEADSVIEPHDAVRRPSGRVSASSQTRRGSALILVGVLGSVR